MTRQRRPRWEWTLDADICSQLCMGRSIKELIMRRLASKMPGLKGRDLLFIELSLAETITNAIEHGNASQAHCRVKILCRLSRTCLRIVVHDEGQGFDWRNLRDPTTPENLENPRGRGIMVTRSYMTVAWNPKGNIIVLKKQRSPEPVDQPLAASA